MLDDESLKRQLKTYLQKIHQQIESYGQLFGKLQ